MSYRLARGRRDSPDSPHEAFPNFTAEESAQTHCQVGNLGLALRVILDWVDERTNS
jgi:hypothetical protein